MTLWIYVGLGVTLLYLIFLFVLAQYGNKLTGLSIGDYFVAGGTLSSLVIFLTMIASAFSAFTFLGGGGIAYDLGVAGIVIVGAVIMADLPLVVIVGDRIWRISKQEGKDYVTPADMLCDRFAGSTSLRLIVALISIGFTIFYVTIQFTGMGLVLNVLTEGLISRDMAAILIGIAMAAYIAIGGMRGVAYTDAIQALLIWAGLIAVSAWVLWTTPSNVYAEATAEFEPVAAIVADPINIYTAAVGFGASAAVWPHIWQRYYSAKRLSGVWAMGFGTSLAALFLLTLFPMIIAFGGLFAFPELDNPDTVILQYILEMPGPLLGVLMAAAVAAAMSTADSMILMTGSIASRDIYQELIGSDLDEETLTFYSKILAGILGLIALAISLVDLGLLVEIAVDLAIPGYLLLLPPALAAFFWARANWQGVVAGLTAGLVVLLYYNVSGAAIPFDLWIGVPGLVVCIVGIVVVSLLTPEPDEENVAEFVHDLSDQDTDELEERHSTEPADD